jgi:EpsD family peptidyl-prolyl cis-trans isomerase
VVRLDKEEINMFSLNKTLCILGIGLTLINVSCSKKETAAENKAETQVVAKVNDDEISIHQVNYQLGRLTQNNKTPLTEDQTKQAAKQVLARLVDQELLKQEAAAAKLDRDPRVLQILEASKNEILAQAYLEQVMQKAEKPTDVEIDAFYNEHPELFEMRRVFRIQELAVDVSKDKYVEIEENLKSIKGINEIANWLKSKNYPFNANSNVRAAEQLPLELLKRLQPLKDGEFAVLATDRSLNIVLIAASQSESISRDKAKPIIEQYFLNQNKTNLAKKTLAELNKKAKVEFVGTFSDMKKEDLASSKQITESEKLPITAGIKSSSETKSEQPPTKSMGSKSNIDKGLAGL